MLLLRAVTPQRPVSRYCVRGLSRPMCPMLALLDRVRKPGPSPGPSLQRKKLTQEKIWSILPSRSKRLMVLFSCVAVLWWQALLASAPELWAQRLVQALTRGLAHGSEPWVCGHFRRYLHYLLRNKITRK